MSVFTGPSTKTGALVTQKRWSCSTIQRPVSMAPTRNVRPALCQLDSLVATNERTGKEGRDVPPSNGTDWSWTPRSPPADRQPVSVHAVLTWRTGVGSRMRRPEDANRRAVAVTPVSYHEPATC